MTTDTAISSPKVRSRGDIVAPLSMSIPGIIYGMTAVSLPLAAADAFGLSGAQTTSMVFALYGIPALLSLTLALAYRQPLLVAWHTGALIFVTSAAGRYSYPEVLGAMMAAGTLILLAGALGLTARLATLIPAPIVLAIVAGSIMPFVVRVFNDASTDRALIGSTILAYLLGRRLLPSTIPPLLPALVAGFSVALLMGNITGVPGDWSLPSLTATLPAFSVPAIVTIAPVIAIFIAVQSNLTTIVYLRSERYDPPKRLLDIGTGAGILVGSLGGIAPISSGSAVIPLIAGPQAGDPRTRHRAVYVSGVAWLFVAVLAGVAADIPRVVPMSLLFSLAGLALVGVFQQALTAITTGPLRVGPLFAFLIASSQLTLLGLGPLFWALIMGIGVSMLLEAQELKSLRTPAPVTG